MQSLDTIQIAECPVLVNKSDILIKGNCFLCMPTLTNFVPMLVCFQVFWMSIISNNIVVIDVLVPPISATDITGTRSLTLGLYIETNQKHNRKKECERQDNGYNKNNLIQFFSA